MKLLLRNHHELRLQLLLRMLSYLLRQPRFQQRQQRHLQTQQLHPLQQSYPQQLQLQLLPSLKLPRPGLNKFLYSV
jgi:hypothetical protein